MKKDAKATSKPSSSSQEDKNKSAEKKSKDFKKKLNEKRVAESKEAEEKRLKAEYEAKLRLVRADYKDPLQLAEGEIMIVIEHSDDPGRKLMSTSHNYDKYHRIAAKIRQWVMRDFPSMKVVIKPNNHANSNIRIGCFEISYFHMKEGNVDRKDIFSKMVDRKWPKWGRVQAKIKEYVKNSNLIVNLFSEKEGANLEGLNIFVKSVWFTSKKSTHKATGSQTGGSGNSATLKNSSTLAKSDGSGKMNKSAASNYSEESDAEDETQKLVDFKVKVSDENGIAKFEHLPVGKYALVFDGNRTYIPTVKNFDIWGDAVEETLDLPLELVEDCFFVAILDFDEIQYQKGFLNENKESETDKSAIKDIDEQINNLSKLEKNLNNLKISLLPASEGESEEAISIPTFCTKSPVSGSSNIVHECVLEPGNYTVIVTDGTEDRKENLELTQGENKILYNHMEIRFYSQEEMKSIYEERQKRELLAEEEDKSRSESAKSKKSNASSAKNNAKPTANSNLPADNEKGDNNEAEKSQEDKQPEAQAVGNDVRPDSQYSSMTDNRVGSAIHNKERIQSSYKPQPKEEIISEDVRENAEEEHAREGALIDTLRVHIEPEDAEKSLPYRLTFVVLDKNGMNIVYDEGTKSAENDFEFDADYDNNSNTFQIDNISHKN